MTSQTVFAVQVRSPRPNVAFFASVRAGEITKVRSLVWTSTAREAAAAFALEIGGKVVAI